jgi:transcription elongation factor GreA
MMGEEVMVVEGIPTIFRREIQEMETQSVFLTNDGRQRAISQLEFLRTVRRAEVAQYLHDAKESGDVIDNAAYEDAKNEQARLEGRIMELEQLLAKAVPISKVDTDMVSLGSVVHLRTPDEREYCYTLVGAFEANPGAGRISNESPVGKALLGHRVGDLVIVSTPGGVKEYTIFSIA